MAKLLASRTAQSPLYAEFVFKHNDWVVDSVDTVKKTLGSTVALSADPAEAGLTGPVANTVTFDAIPLPLGAVVVGGEVIVETVAAGSTAYTVSVGIAGATTAYASAVSALTAGRTALTLSTTVPMTSNSGQNVRLTIAYTVANATGGKVRVRVMYTIDGRANEVTLT
jgi:hypothetical protein